MAAAIGIRNRQAIIGSTQQRINLGDAPVRIRRKKPVEICRTAVGVRSGNRLMSMSSRGPVQLIPPSDGSFHHSTDAPGEQERHAPLARFGVVRRDSCVLPGDFQAHRRIVRLRFHRVSERGPIDTPRVGRTSGASDTPDLRRSIVALSQVVPGRREYARRATCGGQAHSPANALVPICRDPTLTNWRTTTISEIIRRPLISRARVAADARRQYPS